MADKALVSQLMTMLRANKSVNERQLKKDAARRLGRKDVPLPAIREARRKLGIDRASAQREAQKILRAGKMSGPQVIEEIQKRFGVKLFPPELSRLRRKAGIAPLRKRRAAAPAAAGKPGLAIAPLSGKAVRGAIDVTFNGRGSAKELARFFRQLAG